MQVTSYIYDTHLALITVTIKVILVDLVLVVVNEI